MFVAWGIRLTLEQNNGYAIKYGVIYAVIIAGILVAPLFVYIQLVTSINESKNELFLKNRAYEIIAKMDKYKPSDETSAFDFPRYNESRAGLYDENFHALFSLIDDLPIIMIEGYYEHEDRRFYVQTLPKKRYFSADYLIVESQSKNYQIYQTGLLIGLLILFILFLISYFIFKQFALPFEKVNTQLDNFMKDSMHEINTPLSIINVNIDLFTMKNGESKYLNRIKAASKTLSNIYNDMDYLIKQDSIEYPKESLDFSLFLVDRIDYFQVVASLRDIKIKANIEKDIVIFFNKTKLQRVIDNTLSNAIKYSYENASIEVVLTYHDSEIELSIRDYGVGISKPNKIFERYYREDLDKGGFGIGLNIVKKIIDENDVTLSIVSNPKKGSTFTYIF